MVAALIHEPHPRSVHGLDCESVRNTLKRHTTVSNLLHGIPQSDRLPHTTPPKVRPQVIAHRKVNVRSTVLPTLRTGIMSKLLIKIRYLLTC